MNSKIFCYFCLKPGVNLYGENSCVHCRSLYNLYGVYTDRTDPDEIEVFICPISNLNSYFLLKITSNITLVIIDNIMEAVIPNNITLANAQQKFKFYSSFQ